MDLDGLIMGAAGMFDYAQQLGESRLSTPTDDIASILMHAEVDGQRLTPAEFGSFFILLAVAGNETTRNAISWGMHQLTHNPDQRELLRDNFDDMALTAADEIVRWASPVIHMRRTANEDVEVGNTKIAAGEKVVMWYWSGNRDEDYFPDGHRFDITRPNTKDMEGYGAGGPHFCLGRQPRPPRDPGDVRRDLPGAPRSRDHRRTRPPRLRVHQRHQADALRLQRLITDRPARRR